MSSCIGGTTVVWSIDSMVSTWPAGLAIPCQRHISAPGVWIPFQDKIGKGGQEDSNPRPQISVQRANHERLIKFIKIWSSELPENFHKLAQISDFVNFFMKDRPNEYLKNSQMGT